MAHLVFGRDEMLGAWAAKRIPHAPDDPAKAFGRFKAIGVFAGPEKSDALWAVVVFHNYSERQKTCEISAASCNPRWSSKATIREILAFPFLQYECRKVWTATPHRETRIIDWNKRIGFRQEGVLREQFAAGVHCVFCGMMDYEYRAHYLEGDRDGNRERRPRSAAHA